MKNVPVDQVLKAAGASEKQLILNLGIALQYAFAPRGVRYSAPYMEMGTELWAAAEYEIHSILCDRKEGSPREWLDEITSGDIRDLVVAITSILVASLNVPLSIAIPITALIVKRKLATFCKRRPRKPKRSMSEIINQKRKAAKKDGGRSRKGGRVAKKRT